MSWTVKAVDTEWGKVDWRASGDINTGWGIAFGGTDAIMEVPANTSEELVNQLVDVINKVGALPRGRR